MDKSQLLILGNGFDLHCGLKSSYKDFFRGEILDTIGESFGLKQLQAGVSGFWENLLLEYYKVYGKDDYSWCDIEKIIKNTLLSIFVLEKYGGTELWRIAYENRNSNKKPNEIISWIEGIDLFLFENCLKFFKESAFNSVEDFKQYLLKELKNLEQRFCKYLKKQIGEQNVGTLNEKYIINATNLLAKITKFSRYTFYKMSDIIDNYCELLIDDFKYLSGVYILNFNYTSLFDILDGGYPCKYANVHGKLCYECDAENCDSASIIFGIDDNLIQSQGAVLELRLFSKTYRKMLNSEKDTKILPLNDGMPIKIKFYGHSLSEADYSYFQSIFDYYDLYGNNKVSLTFYYSKGYEIYDSAYKLISEYGKTLTNKDQGKNLIHKLLLENRLHIQEVKD